MILFDDKMLLIPLEQIHSLEQLKAIGRLVDSFGDDEEEYICDDCLEDMEDEDEDGECICNDCWEKRQQQVQNPLDFINDMINNRN